MRKYSRVAGGWEGVVGRHANRKANMPCLSTVSGCPFPNHYKPPGFGQQLPASNGPNGISTSADLTQDSLARSLIDAGTCDFPLPSIRRLLPCLWRAGGTEVIFAGAHRAYHANVARKRPPSYLRSSPTSLKSPSQESNFQRSFVGAAVGRLMVVRPHTRLELPVSTVTYSQSYTPPAELVYGLLGAAGTEEHAA